MTLDSLEVYLNCSIDSTFIAAIKRDYLLPKAIKMSGLNDKIKCISLCTAKIAID